MESSESAPSLIASKRTTPSPDSPENILLQQAEDVCAYLVQLRGGAPFLSGADQHLLHGWLDDGVPVAVILASMDRVARRRQKRRTKNRMTLYACRGEVRKMMGLPRQSITEPAPTTDSNPLQKLAREVSEMDVPETLSEARQALTLHLRAIDCSGAIEDVAQAAICGARQFLETAWTQLKPEHPTLLKQASEDLAPLQPIMTETAWSEALEEAARQRVRDRFPLVSAQVVWDRLNTI